MSNTIQRNHMIDILKGICSIFVIITHFTWSDVERKIFLFPFWIDMAVPIFMIISGYTYSISFEHSKISRLRDAYSRQRILSKFARYTVPFMIMYLVEIILLFIEHMVSGIELGHGWLILWIMGGYGPGGYYYPIMIQFIFLFPIINYIICKYEAIGLLILGGANGAYEIVKSCIGMREDCYRLLIFRYILLIAFGCYFYNTIQKTKCNFVFWIAGLVGLGFIILVKYIGYTPKILYYWTGTSFLASLYIIPFAKGILTDPPFKKLCCEPLENLGKASYHIFLVQMVYWYFLAKIVSRFIVGRFAPLIFGIIFCVVIGYLFFKIELIVIDRWKKYCRSLLN